MAHLYVVLCAFKCLALLRSQLVDVLVYVADSAILGYEFACSYFSDSLHAWDVVGRVSADGKDLHYLFRSVDVVFFADLGAVDDFVLAA